MSKRKPETRRLVLRVTEEDIAKGKIRRACPIWRALRRQTKARTIAVGYYSAYFKGGPWSLPESATRFASNFDAGRPVKPATFILTREE